MSKSRILQDRVAKFIHAHGGTVTSLELREAMPDVPAWAVYKALSQLTERRVLRRSPTKVMRDNASGASWVYTYTLARHRPTSASDEQDVSDLPVSTEQPNMNGYGAVLRVIDTLAAMPITAQDPELGAWVETLRAYVNKRTTVQVCVPGLESTLTLTLDQVEELRRSLGALGG